MVPSLLTYITLVLIPNLCLPQFSFLLGEWVVLSFCLCSVSAMFISLSLVPPIYCLACSRYLVIICMYVSPNMYLSSIISSVMCASGCWRWAYLERLRIHNISQMGSSPGWRILESGYPVHVAITPPPRLPGAERSSLKTIQIARHPTCPGAEVTHAVILKGLAYLHIPS